MNGATSLVEQRIDQWLWCARQFKTRSLATKFVSDVGVRLTRSGKVSRIEKPSHLIKTDDIIVFTKKGDLRRLRVKSFALRRGPASEAAQLFERLDNLGEAADGAAPQISSGFAV